MRQIGEVLILLHFTKLDPAVLNKLKQFETLKLMHHL